MPEPEARIQRMVMRLFRVWSGFYDRPIFQKTIYGRVHQRFLEEAVDLHPRRVLDVGCGTGEFLLTAARHWPEAELTGLDLSPDMLAHARRKNFGRSVTLVEGSVYELPFEDASFDLITNSISSHFYLEGERAFAEMARVLKPGGMLLQASLSTGPLSYFPGLAARTISVPGAIYRGPEEQRRLWKNAGVKIRASRVVLPTVWLYHGLKK